MTHCKICTSKRLKVFAHTATCRDCGVLLCYPYPTSDDELLKTGRQRRGQEDQEALKEIQLNWHIASGPRNHHNFTSAALFTLCDEDRQRPLNVLDYGGGGGQFALSLKSLFPLCEAFITDMSDVKLLRQYRPMNQQIPFADFAADTTVFDVIFLNDVFEHLSDPLGVLKMLGAKLVANGRIYIDTPRQFWIYPATKPFKRLHEKLLRGTCDEDHQQIWSRQSFEHVVRESGFAIARYQESCEFTMGADFYMNNMGITNPVLRFAGRRLYGLGRMLAKNKILAVLTH